MFFSFLTCCVLKRTISSIYDIVDMFSVMFGLG